MDNPSRRTVGAGGWGLGKDPARGPGVSSREGLCSAPNPLGRSRADASAAQRRAIFRGGMGILAMFADFSKATGKTSYGAFTDQLKEKFERAEGLAGLKSFIQLLHSYPSPGSRPCAPSSSILRMIPRSRDMETIVEIPLAHARSHPQSKNSNDVRRSGICRFLGAKAPPPWVGWQTPNDSSAAPRLGPRPLPSRCVLGAEPPLLPTTTPLTFSFSSLRQLLPQPRLRRACHRGFARGSRGLRSPSLRLPAQGGGPKMAFWP